MTYLEYLIQSKRVVNLNLGDLGNFDVIVKSDKDNCYLCLNVHPLSIIPNKVVVFYTYDEAKKFYDGSLRDSKNFAAISLYSDEEWALERLKKYL